MLDKFYLENVISSKFKRLSHLIQDDYFSHDEVCKHLNKVSTVPHTLHTLVKHFRFGVVQFLLPLGVDTRAIHKNFIFKIFYFDTSFDKVLKCAQTKDFGILK